MAQPPAEPLALPSLPAAVLWDMDGTLIDTEGYWIEAEHRLVASYGGQWSEADGLELVGKALEDSAEIIRRRAGLPLGVEQIVDYLLDAVISEVVDALPWRPGALKLHQALHEAGVPMALVTMSYARFAEPVAAAIPHGGFDVIVSGDQVTHGKPDPEAYLTAADQLGADVTRCVALEDSRAGVAAALASGAQTIAIRYLVDIPPAEGLSRVSSLTEVTPDVLARVAAGAHIDTL